MPALAMALVGIGLAYPALELDRRGHRRRDVDLREEVVFHGSFRQHRTLEEIVAHGRLSTRFCDLLQLLDESALSQQRCSVIFVTSKPRQDVLTPATAGGTQEAC